MPNGHCQIAPQVPGPILIAFPPAWRYNPLVDLEATKLCEMKPKPSAMIADKRRGACDRQSEGDQRWELAQSVWNSLCGGDIDSPDKTTTSAGRFQFIVAGVRTEDRCTETQNDRKSCAKTMYT